MVNRHSIERGKLTRTFMLVMFVWMHALFLLAAAGPL